MMELDDAGRLKIARRILAKSHQRWDELVEQGAGDTGAQFQERCTQLALALHFGDDVEPGGVEQPVASLVGDLS